jgi:hypothetical protein
LAIVLLPDLKYAERSIVLILVAVELLQKQAVLVSNEVKIEILAEFNKVNEAVKAA